MLGKKGLDERGDKILIPASSLMAAFLMCVRPGLWREALVIPQFVLRELTQHC